MTTIQRFILCTGVFLCFIVTTGIAFPKSTSVYQSKLDDSEAVYFTPENFKISVDGKTDVSDALQEAINQVKAKRQFGIVFIPEGTYKISKTIYIPVAVRLIGYGANRPLIVLGKNSPGFQEPDPNDKGNANYLFWFVNSAPRQGRGINDANASTFYSAFTNIDIKIEDGNPSAVALRAHFAQHSFISHCDIHIGRGKAGVFDIGNEMEDVRFFGGEYGIYTTKTSPGWQFLMIDTYFEGQRKAAIKTREAGLTIIRMHACNTPVAISIDDDSYEKLFISNSRFENISKAGISISLEGSAMNQISVRDVVCRKVPTFADYRWTDSCTKAPSDVYVVNDFTYGLHIDSLGYDEEFKSIGDFQVLKTWPAPAIKDIPSFPETNLWVNIKTLGAKGDGETDDYNVIAGAIEKYQTIYFPQGWYKVSKTIKLKPNTKLIGLHPIATQFLIDENTDSFAGFGGPVALVETSQGGTNIINGIGLNTGQNNPRAVACKWMSGENSYMNDVKFVGGHGTMQWKPNQWNNQDESIAWDTQYWSLWITNGGGGTFKDIWTASTFATSGAYISNTSTPGRIYAMSVEHHVRNEVRLKNVSNWEIHALQLEEEGNESKDCQPLEIDSCSNLLFSNFYIYMVTRVTNPFPYSVRTWNCKNVEFLNFHNFSQTKFAANLALYDINTDREVRPWEFTRLTITGNETRKQPIDSSVGKVNLLASGFEFAEGACADSKGNVYFSESRLKRIYKWSSKSNSLSLLCDYQWEPLSLAVDSLDNLLVVFKYTARPGYATDGSPKMVRKPEEAINDFYNQWNTSRFGTLVYSINPENPDESIRLLDYRDRTDFDTVYKALYPLCRPRALGNNGQNLNDDTKCFVAPDGKTIIPACFDLLRSNTLTEAFPGKTMLAVDDNNKRTVTVNVASNGNLSNIKQFVARGEYGLTKHSDGNVYIAAGDVFVYSEEGKPIDRIEVEQRPATLVFGGAEKNTLFITARSGLYGVKIK